MRIANVDIPQKKHISIGLTAIYGIGKTRAIKICDDASVDPQKKGHQLTEEEQELLRKAIADSGFEIEGDLRRAVLTNINNLKAIKCYRGSRHMKGLPCNGQKSKNNARTVKRLRGKKKK